MERPSIRQLESLVAVADSRSFRRAATTLGISQPALSAQVQAAEHVLGIQVFERDRRSVLITPAGEDVVSRAREALIAVDAVGDAAARRGAPLVKQRGKLTEKDLDDQTVLLLEDGHCLRDQALEICKRAGAVESVEVRATSLPTLVQMVAGGLGVTLLPEAAIASLVQ